MNIMDVFMVQAGERGDAVALIESKEGEAHSLTFAEIERASAHAADMLAKAGLRAGDGVLVFQPMSSELYIALLAIFRLGLVALFIDPWAGKDHLETCCRLFPPKALIATPKAHLLRLVSPALRRIPVKFSTGSRVPGPTGGTAGETPASVPISRPATPTRRPSLPSPVGAPANPRRR
jgi:acyl-coenzyme A synthetase/AMP-(fatty) acid ligase